VDGISTSACVKSILGARGEIMRIHPGVIFRVRFKPFKTNHFSWLTRQERISSLNLGRPLELLA